MDADRRRLAVFVDERPRLLGISYRMLGSLADAEDVVQEAWLRWSTVDLEEVESPQAMLTTVITRLAVDRLRRIRARRETYTGSWLPEPIAVAPNPTSDPQTAAELADSLSTALLVIMETLSPLERAAFVLREIFEYPYAQVAEVLDRTEAAVRQLVHRARARLVEGRARFEADRTAHDQVVQRFRDACQAADVGALLDVLSPDVVIVSDGGGLAKAPLRPVHGADKVARLLSGISRHLVPGSTFALERFNGATGIVIRAADDAAAALSVSVSAGSVISLHFVTNPEKLQRLQAKAAVLLV